MQSLHTNVKDGGKRKEINMDEVLHRTVTFQLEDFGRELLQILKKHNDRPTEECLLEIVASREKWATTIIESVQRESKD